MKTKIYCDIGINHQGSLDISLELAKNFGRHVDGVKFQIRTPDICVPESTWQRRKKLPLTGKEVSYIEYKHVTELSNAQLKEFDEVVKGEWFASVWDIPALLRYLDLKSDSANVILKVPSALCKNEEFAKAVQIAKLERPEIQVFVSLGDCKDVEEMRIVYDDLWSSVSAIPMYCLPCYGADVYCPNEIIEFWNEFGEEGESTGYSTHSGRLRDIEFAVALGFDIVEYHCTFSKLMDGSDHSSSYTLAQAEKMKLHIADIEARVRPDRSEFWGAIDEKLSSLRPTRVL